MSRSLPRDSDSVVISWIKIGGLLLLVVAARSHPAFEVACDYVSRLLLLGP